MHAFVWPRRARLCLAKASNLSFDDYDLDATDLGGNLTWALAEDEADRGLEEFVARLRSR